MDTYMEKYTKIDKIVQENIKNNVFNSLNEFETHFTECLKEIVDTDEYKTVFSKSATKEQYVLYLKLIEYNSPEYTNIFIYRNWDKDE